MRVIAGDFKARKLTSITGRKIRPTSDRIREALFSIISSKIENALVLDLFAGTGALGIEALSRGADRTVFVDNSKESIQIINKNIELFSIKERTDVLLYDALNVLSSKAFPILKFDIIFMDPPYDKGLVSNIFKNNDLLNVMKDDSIIIAEQSIRENALEKVAGFDL
ncbi:MAG: 16S rRNA (guanine(966)-N(2))-methyltransferase RsmD, partial [Desulfobacteraceae bacterium]|nr:16S rRNA (guanine(966)-N(2))-methyltransferase RsmD [Desulfobacteraceae bacterium]